jgi:hypothetical protein
MSQGFEHRVVRRERIGDRQLVVLDDLFSAADVASLYGFLNRLPYRLDDVDTENTAYSRHWKAELPRELAGSNVIFRHCVEATHALMPGGPFKLGRMHANLHLYGDLQFPHVDLIDGVTAVYFANPEWHENWMGETVFYDARREPLHALAPRPGRVAMFHADIVHRAGVPSRECFAPRISVAFKFVPA